MVRFTPTGVGTTEISDPGYRTWRGSPPQAWGQRTSTSTLQAILSVHPHRRGDNEHPEVLGKATEDGSPPQGWGQRPSLLRCLRRASVHPTSVGTTTWWLSRSKVNQTVHPHRCGDNESALCRTKYIGGSPPQVWGQRCKIEPADFGEHGSPPQVWGQRGRPRQSGQSLAVHPHRRGDNVICACA